MPRRTKAVGLITPLSHRDKVNTETWIMCASFSWLSPSFSRSCRISSPDLNFLGIVLNGNAYIMTSQYDNYYFTKSSAPKLG